MEFGFNKQKSIWEFLIEYEKFRSQKEKEGFDKTYIEEKCELFSGYEFTNEKYEKYWGGDKDYIDKHLGIAKYVEPIFREIRRRPHDRELYLSRMPSYALVQIVGACKNKFEDGKVSFTEADMAQSFIASADNIADHYFKEPEFTDSSDTIDVGKLISKYPDVIVTLGSKVVKTLTTPIPVNAKHIAVMEPASKQISVVQIHKNIVGNGLDREHLSYFDIHVFEAVMSLYENGNKKITLPMIYKMVMGRPDQRMTSSKIHDYKNSEIFEAVIKLLNYRVLHQGTSEYYSGHILNGSVHLINGQVVFTIAGESDCYKEMLQSSEVTKIPLDEVMIEDMSYSRIRIALKSYLLHEIVNVKDLGKRSISINIEAILDATMLEEKKHLSSFRKTQRENTILILNNFIKNGFISEYEIKGKLWTSAKIKW